MEPSQKPESSTFGLILAVVSLAVMPRVAYAKRQTGRALIAMLPVIVWQRWETLEEAREKPSEDQ